MKVIRQLTAIFVVMSVLSPTTSRAQDNPWKQKVLPATILVGGIGCALGGYTIVGGALVLGSALTFGLSYFRNSCPQPEGPSLADALKNLDAEVPLNSADEMIRYFYNAFQETSNFAVADAGSFLGNIAEGQEATILDRAKKPINNAREKAAKDKNLQLATSLQINQDPEERDKMAQKIGENVVISKTGICTTFAGLAYTLLTQGGRAKKVPVEIFSRRETGGRAQASTHLFTVVGRDPNSNAEDPTTWGASARIVDLWLGALGNAFVYQPDSQDYQPWLKNLKVVHSNM